MTPTISLLVFKNPDAAESRIEMMVDPIGMEHVCLWYFGFYSGDRITVTYNGEKLKVDANGEIN